MGLMDRLRIPAVENERRRALGVSDLDHPVTTDISGEFGSEWGMGDLGLALTSRLLGVTQRYSARIPAS